MQRSHKLKQRERCNRTVIHQCYGHLENLWNQQMLISTAAFMASTRWDGPSLYNASGKWILQKWRKLYGEIRQGFVLLITKEFLPRLDSMSPRLSIHTHTFIYAQLHISSRLVAHMMSCRTSGVGEKLTSATRRCVLGETRSVALVGKGPHKLNNLDCS